MDDSVDVVDAVNALLKLGVGDSYRLEHIKQAFVQNKTIWVTDENYLKRLREKYLVKQTPDVKSDGEIIFENEPEEKETIHCWKCGKKVPLGANFCMACGTSIFEIDTTSQSDSKSKSDNSSFVKSIPLKIPLLVGIPILILIILGGGYTQGYFDNTFERSPSTVSPISPVVVDDVVLSNSTDSKCGSGTIFDPVTNSCVLGTTVSSDGTDSKCGSGTIFDPVTNSCILDN